MWMKLKKKPRREKKVKKVIKAKLNEECLNFYKAQKKSKKKKRDSQKQKKPKKYLITI